MTPPDSSLLISVKPSRLRFNSIMQVIMLHYLYLLFPNLHFSHVGHRLLSRNTQDRSSSKRSFTVQVKESEGSEIIANASFAVTIK